MNLIAVAIWLSACHFCYHYRVVNGEKPDQAEARGELLVGWFIAVFLYLGNFV